MDAAAFYRAARIVKPAMPKPDDIWQELLREARKRALSDGKESVAEYLELRSRNDHLRSLAIEWLAGIFVEEALSGILNSPPEIERIEPHHFEYERARHTGVMHKIQFGVRSLLLEAGWPRNHDDGILYGGALAVGRLTHPGMPKMNYSLALLEDSGRPVWFAGKPEGVRMPVDTLFVRRHILALA